MIEIILNDIAWKHKCSDKYLAIENVKNGIDILMELRKQDPSFKLYSTEKVTGSELAPEYYFGQMLLLLPLNDKIQISLPVRQLPCILSSAYRKEMAPENLNPARFRVP